MSVRFFLKQDFKVEKHVFFRILDKLKMLNQYWPYEQKNCH